MNNQLNVGMCINALEKVMDYLVLLTLFGACLLLFSVVYRADNLMFANIQLTEFLMIQVSNIGLGMMIGSFMGLSIVSCIVNQLYGDLTKLQGRMPTNNLSQYTNLNVSTFCKSLIGK